MYESGSSSTAKSPGMRDTGFRERTASDAGAAKSSPVPERLVRKRDVSPTDDAVPSRRCFLFGGGISLGLRGIFATADDVLLFSYIRRYLDSKCYCCS